MPRPTQDLLRTLPAATGTPVTIDDVVRATAGWLIYALLVATGGWYAAPTLLSVLNPMVLLGAMVLLVFLDVRIYRAATPPLGLMALSMGGYSLLIGVFSFAYASLGGGLGLVGFAAVGTVATAAAVVALYQARILRADTPLFRSTVAAAGLGYLAVIGISLLVQVFGGASLFGPGVLGWFLCGFGAVVAALTLAMAAADIDAAIDRGAPRHEASRLGFAFAHTMLWLYLEILRLLARARSN